MADSAERPERVPPTGAASLQGKPVSEEVKQGDDPLSSSQKAEPSDSNVDGGQGSLTSSKPRTRSGALSQKPEEATTVGGGDSGRSGIELSQEGGREMPRRSADGTNTEAVHISAPQTIINGMLTLSTQCHVMQARSKAAT